MQTLNSVSLEDSLASIPELAVCSRVYVSASVRPFARLPARPPARLPVGRSVGRSLDWMTANLGPGRIGSALSLSIEAPLSVY